MALPPDYWLMTSYPYCDPAPDGVYYLRRIVELLGRENASHLLVTDLKGPGHAEELRESIISGEGHSGRDMLEWHFQKCAEYGFAGWWIYSYQDQEASTQRTGLRCLDGTWKSELLQSVQQQALRARANERVHRRTPQDTANVRACRSRRACASAAPETGLPPRHR